MVEIKWTARAKKDLKQIHLFIANDSLLYADRFVAILFERVEILENFPNSGRVVPETNDKSIRELIQGNYRIFYKIENRNLIYVLRIHHSSKLIS